MESSVFSLCSYPANVDVSANCIPAIPIASGADGPIELGPITRLPEGATLHFCGVGFNDLTVKVYWEGGYYFVFLQDLPDDCLRKLAARQCILAEDVPRIA